MFQIIIISAITLFYMSFGVWTTKFIKKNIVDPNTKEKEKEGFKSKKKIIEFNKIIMLHCCLWLLIYWIIFSQFLSVSSMFHLNIFGSPFIVSSFNCFMYLNFLKIFV